MLHGVIRDHVDDFLRAAADRADGVGLPEFITREDPRPPLPLTAAGAEQPSLPGVSI